MVFPTAADDADEKELSPRLDEGGTRMSLSAPHEVEKFEQWLFRFGAWITAAELAAYLPEFSDRKLRILASASRNIVTGNMGYKHKVHATKEERLECYHRLMNQGREMIERAKHLHDELDSDQTPALILQA